MRRSRGGRPWSSGATRGHCSTGAGPSARRPLRAAAGGRTPAPRADRRVARPDPRGETGRALRGGPRGRCRRGCGPRHRLAWPVMGQSCRRLSETRGTRGAGTTSMTAAGPARVIRPCPRLWDRDARVRGARMPCGLRVCGPQDGAASAAPAGSAKAGFYRVGDRGVLPGSDAGVAGPECPHSPVSHLGWGAFVAVPAVEGIGACG